MYEDFDQFEQHRPRPARWRIALVSFCYLILGATIANALLSVAEVALLSKATDVKARWIIHATPWMSLKPYVRTTMRLHVMPIPMLIASAVFLAFALIVIWLWPVRSSIGSRLLAIAMAQCLAAFGGAMVPELADPITYAAPAVAALICMLGEWSANTLLGSYWNLETPGRRLAMWSVRILPSSVAIAAAAWTLHNEPGVYAAALLAGSTLFANLARRPSRSLETMKDVQMREAAAAWPVATLALLVGVVLVFGFRPPRAFVLDDGKVEHVDLGAAAKRLAPSEPVIEIHWSRKKSPR
jgi:hypothetical protein